jgi:hypothetical protein
MIEGGKDLTRARQMERDDMTLRRFYTLLKPDSEHFTPPQVNESQLVIIRELMDMGYKDQRTVLDALSGAVAQLHPDWDTLDEYERYEVVAQTDDVLLWQIFGVPLKVDNGGAESVGNTIEPFPLDVPRPIPCYRLANNTLGCAVLGQIPELRDPGKSVLSIALGSESS